MEDSKLAESELSQKNVVYYQVMLSAFLESRNEFDRQLLTISVAFLGGFFAFQDKLKPIAAVYVMSIITALFFLATCALVLTIFHTNSEFILSELKSDHENVNIVSKNLDTMDACAKVFFGLGILSGTILIFINFMSNAINN